MERPAWARPIRFSLWFLGVGVVLWALFHPLFRDTEGFLEKSVLLPFAFSASLAVWGWVIASKLIKPGFWFGLAIVGQAASLQLINASKTMSYQHYTPLPDLISQIHPVVLFLLVIQSALVIIGFSQRLFTTLRWLRNEFRLYQILGMALIFFLFVATVSPLISTYLSEVALASLIQLINLLNVVLIILSLPEETGTRLNDFIERWLTRPLDRVGTSHFDQFAILAALWVFILAGLLSFFVYQRHPHIPDEVAYLYQARYLAQGKLSMPAPPVREAFNVYLMQFKADQWFAVPPVGWPAMLAFGVLLGIPWLVNPFLGGVNILLSFIVVRELYDQRLARKVVFLLALSPWYLFMAMNFMTHTFTLTAGLIAFVGVAMTRKTGVSWWALLGGAGAGITSLIRPLDGLIVALVTGAWALGLWGKRLKFSGLVMFGVGVIATGMLVFPYNLVLSGHPTEFPIMTYTDQVFGKNSNAFGFGPDRGMGWPIDPFPGHSPLDALVNANLNFFSINIELFGWGIGSLLFIAIFLTSNQYKQSDWIMLLLFGVVFLAHFFYYFSGGPDFGARYWYLMILPLAVMTARGIGRLQHIAISPHLAGRVGLLVLVLSAGSLINFIPWRAIDKYHHYLGMRPDIRYLSQKYHFGDSLVLVSGESHPDYASAMIYNPLDLYAHGTLYAWDRDPDTRAQVLNAYPDREVWFVDGPSKTGRGFEVVAGPIPVQKLLTGSTLPH